MNLSYPIKLVHLLSCPNDERERTSVSQLSSLAKYGFQYVQHINPPYVGTVPKYQGVTTCLLGEYPEFYLRGPYGCYSAHKRAVLEEFDTPFLMVCECDCILNISPEKFVEKIVILANAMLKENLICISIGGEEDSRCCYLREETQELLFPWLFYYTHCLLYQKSERFTKTLKTTNWEFYDIFLSRIRGDNPCIAITQEQYATQHPGKSLISP